MPCSWCRTNRLTETAQSPPLERGFASQTREKRQPWNSPPWDRKCPACSQFKFKIITTNQIQSDQIAGGAPAIPGGEVSASDGQKSQGHADRLNSVWQWPQSQVEPGTPMIQGLRSHLLGWPGQLAWPGREATGGFEFTPARGKNAAARTPLAASQPGPGRKPGNAATSLCFS